MRYVLCSKKPAAARKFSGDGQFELHFEQECDIAPAFFAGKTKGANCWEVIRRCTCYRIG